MWPVFPVQDGAASIGEPPTHPLEAWHEAAEEGWGQ